MEEQNISDFDPPRSVDMDDSIREMTASYSEISIDSNDSDADVDSFIFQKPSTKPTTTTTATTATTTTNNTSRPASLEFKSDKMESPVMQFLQSAGTVEKDGDMVLFFSQDLETKFKLASPVSRQENVLGYGDSSRSATPCLYRQALQPSIPPLDASVLNALEADARKVATAVDSLTENLAGLLHSVSALTVDCLETYRDAVCNTCDAVDSNIKLMYQLMAKCEELSKTMKPAYQLAEKIKEIKRLLDLYENAVTT